MYWERDQEITLLWTVLEALDSNEQTGEADEIICGLIDMGLVDCHRAPVAQQQWQDLWHDGRGVTRRFIERWYVTDTSEVDDD